MKESTMALNMRQNGAGTKNIVCPVCGAVKPKKRGWHSFCSPRCRKKAWLINHRTGIYTDVRNDIAAIKADMAWIVRHLGIGKEVESEKPTLTGRGERAVPGKGDGGSGTITLAGQLSLPV